VRFVPSLQTCLLVAALGPGALVVGCDQVSRPDATQPPSVRSLAVQPDSVIADNLPPDQVQDSTVRVPLTIAASASDPDGSVERVTFTIEPASNPRGTLVGTLSRDQGTQYRRDIALQVPIATDELYTVRVFAVDDDSLASNQSIGHFRFVGK